LINRSKSSKTERNCGGSILGRKHGYRRALAGASGCGAALWCGEEKWNLHYDASAQSYSGYRQRSGYLPVARSSSPSPLAIALVLADEVVRAPGSSGARLSIPSLGAHLRPRAVRSTGSSTKHMFFLFYRETPVTRSLEAGIEGTETEWFSFLSRFLQHFALRRIL
jgi:hypothetical protein